MKKFFFIILFLVFVCNSCKNNSTINNDIFTIGTFNMEWLGDGIDDNKPRTETDLQQIANILMLANIDVIGVQEIENETALKSIVSKMEGYNFKLSKQDTKQKIGIIYKNYIKVEVIGDYTPLTLTQYGYDTRPGYLLNISKNDFDIVLMIVHLKSTSRYDSTAEIKEASRYMRTLQNNILSDWTDSISTLTSNKKLAIIGDFNDYPDRKHNRTLEQLATNPKLHFLTEGQHSTNPKFKFNKSIDHIIINNVLKKYYIEGSVFQFDFNAMLSDSAAINISDHCPVFVQFDISRK